MDGRKSSASLGPRFCRAHPLAAAVFGTLLTVPSALFSEPEAPAPLFLPLRREVIPVHHGGKLVSFKTSYSGLVHAGGGRGRELRVVFDTGSGHVVLPAATCRAKACLTKVRYNAEETGSYVDIDGERASSGSRGDSLTIGFGKGEVRGHLVRDRLCLGPSPEEGSEADAELCVETGIVAAYNMSSDPFENFTFDGIVGLGLQSLAVSGHFSFLANLASKEGGRFSSGQFAVFLAEGDDEEESEIAFGGYNPAHLLEPLTWVPLTRTELGYWAVEVLGLYVDDVRLDVCSDGPCNGILDTGTSHLGVPPAHVDRLEELLLRPAGDVGDCRKIEAPVVRVELRGFNLTILPENYMRRLPLDEDLLQSMDSKANSTEGAANHSTADGAGAGNATRMSCTAKLMQVKLPQLGPNAFLLGEPALHRYYTAYDAKALRVGLGLAARRKRPPEPEMEVNHDEIFLMQQMQGVRPSARQTGGTAGS